MQWADEQVMCVVIIEQQVHSESSDEQASRCAQRAIDNIDEIAAVPGIDLLFIGVVSLRCLCWRRSC